MVTFGVIGYSEQKMHNKMTSFMKINTILISQYISKGTILQKYIDNLKEEYTLVI